jgi:acetylornithine deacetylase/succinyl-diaminopimelate desuccinylase-like protein
MYQESPVIKLLSKLVSIPSINPSLDQEPIGCGEEPVTAFLEENARNAGLVTERQKVATGRDNLLVRLTPAGEVKNRVLLAPHLDVVPAPDEAFIPKIIGNQLHGRGSCDTKGSVACFFQALLDLASSSQRPEETEILFVGLVDEEFAQAGSRTFAESTIAGDLAIVGEPTGLDVVSSHKGSLWIQLETTGKAAHGSTPEKGINAIEKMHQAMNLLLGEYQNSLNSKSDPLLGKPTLSLGAIKGGDQPNIVPSRCQLELDRRTIPGETVESVIEELTSLFEPLKTSAPKIKISRSVPCPALNTDPSLPFVRLFLQCTQQQKVKGVPYFTDASPISMGGTPSIVFGPGNIAQAHAEDEWIDLSQLEQARSIILNFLRELP